MTKTLFPFLVVTALMASASAREFKSADGKQTLEAEFVRYDKGRDQVTLRLANGRNLVTTSKFFSDSDQAYFDEQAKSSSLASAIGVEVEDNSEKVSQDGWQVRMRMEKLNYTFKIRNRSDFPLENVEVKYWVVANKGEKPTVYKDTQKLSSVPANGSSELAGPKVSLVKSARATCDCPAVIADAKKMGGQNVLGTRVEVYSADGKLLYEDSSSSKVDKAIGK